MCPSTTSQPLLHNVKDVIAADQQHRDAENDSRNEKRRHDRLLVYALTQRNWDPPQEDWQQHVVHQHDSLLSFSWLENVRMRSSVP
jgi:hypothetical protein